MKMIMLLITLASPLSANAQTTKYKATDNSVSAKLCMIALRGNAAAMHNEIKSSGLSKKYVSQKVTCNGMSIYDFSMKFGKNKQAMAKVLDIS